MNSNEKLNIRRKVARRELFSFLLATGNDSNGKIALALLYIALAVYLVVCLLVNKAKAADGGVMAQIIANALSDIIPLYLVGGGMALAVYWMIPQDRKDVQEALISIGLLNNAGTPPYFRRRRRDKENPNIEIWEFANYGIPREDWEDARASIEATLNINIVDIRYGDDKRQILVYAVPAETQLPSMLEWDNEYLSPKNFILVLGKSLLGNVEIDLNKVPHILIGGSTGSGKTILLKLLLFQAHMKGAKVYIADFKGGVDYGSFWHRNVELCFDISTLIQMLTELAQELEYRKSLLREADCANITEYNERTGENLMRIIFACDEVAELLDKTGLSAEQKKLVQIVESKLALIARQGRAFGIHLVLATQRPDANILTGQIKNNIDYRVCGRADNVLSQIILDNTDAADLIPKDAHGRFLLNGGTVFQGFWLDEDSLDDLFNENS